MEGEVVPVDDVFEVSFAVADYLSDFLGHEEERTTLAGDEAVSD